MQDSLVCRFCLDSEIDKKNPFIEPCECRGSIQYVHVLCLNKWRLLNPTRNGDICFLCLTPYRLAIGEILEHLPDEDRFGFFFVRFPFLLWGLVNYIGAIQYSLFQKKDSFFLFEVYQYIFQLIYVCLFLNMWYVRNKSQYWRLWNKKDTYYILALHFLSNYFIHDHNVYAVIPLNACFLYYYRHHRRILHAINNS